MKAVILAGGLGTRLAEETVVRPKPMVEIGGRPILWHIMKTYARHGLTDFVICLGYKGYLIKEYFANYFLHQSDVTFDLSQNRVTVHQNHSEAWKVTLVDTGADTMTGGRIKRAAPYLGDDHEFCLTYGDGVCDIDIRQLIRFHREQGTLATVTVTQPPGRFGRITMDQTRITRFEEKPGDGSWVNAGYFVLSRKVLDYIDGDATVWERGPLERLAQEGQMSAFVHNGFWQCMDTLRDMQLLEGLWASGRAPWKVW
jgi:glucose-1-phosphate cytidylyltransferase